MKGLCFYLFCAFVATVGAKKADYEKSEGVLTLNLKNYDKAVEEFEYLFVYFYAPWCGHCKALGPEFVKAGQMLKEKDSSIILGRVDGTEESDLMDKHDVQGYPTLKLYRKQMMVPYTGGRMAPEMVDWLEMKIGPPAKIMKTLPEVKKFIKDNEVVVVGFFSEEAEEEAAKYNLACLDYEEYPVAITSDKEIASHYKVEDKSVMLFKKHDERRVLFTGEFSTANFREFIAANNLPTVIEFNHANAQRIFKHPEVKSHLLVFHNKTEDKDKFEKEYAMLKQVGKDFKNDVLFVSVDVGVEDHRRMVEFLGVRHRINNDTFPTMRIVTMNPDVNKFKPEDTTVTEDNIRKFVGNYMEGKVARHLFQEPVPKDWDATSVKYLTAVNFNEVVMDKEKNVLIMFYAPWCGHCKSLMPVWDELGEKHKDYVVAKMDSTVNEIPDMAVFSFPTIKLYRKDNTEAEFNGERTVEGVTKFLETDGVYGQAAPDHDEL